MGSGNGLSRQGVRLRTLGPIGVEGPGAELSAILRQPKTLAVLVFLAVTSRNGCVRRDRLVATFWPDLDHKRARAALRNTLYLLRRALPDGSILSEGDEMLRVDPTLVRTDAVDFDEALERGRLEAALDVYIGDFMPGFHLAGGNEFGAWRDSRDREYRRAALAAAEDLAATAESDASPSDVLRWLERAVSIAPFDEEPAQRLIAALLERGNRGAASAVYREHAARLRQLGLTPSRATTQLVVDADGGESFEAQPLPALSLVDRTATRGADVAARGADVAPEEVSSGSNRLAAALGVACLVALAGIAFASQRAWTEEFSAFRSDVAAGRFVAAYDRGRGLRPRLSGNEEFEALWQQATAPASVRTEPAGAVVSVQDYSTPGAPWVRLGVTPLDEVSLPATYLRWRLERPGHEPVVRAGFDLAFRSEITFDLPGREAPADMAYVSGDALNPGAPRRARLDPFWMDRTEVTNAEFGVFVREGGYHRVRPGLPGGSVDLSGFVDRAGLPGPSTWTAGLWPMGRDEHPVRGVSWYEASAYCAWAGKELPTAYHWFAAGGYAGYSDILAQSNFSESGPRAVGASGAIGPYGHHDLAGNVREWVANELEGGRAILGGAWDTPPYQFMSTDVADPLDRSDHNGFRCARLATGPDHPTRAVLPSRQGRIAHVTDVEVDVSGHVDHFSYDATPLRATLDSVSLGHPIWRREFVTFDAAYGGERMGAVVFTPRSGSPPFETVVFHPGADAALLPTAAAARTVWFDFLARGNYAVVYPVYKGTYERRAPVSGPIGIRDRFVHRVKDVRRTLDYLETRGDLDLTSVTYYGFSQGASLAPVVTTVEPRIAAAVVLSGGLAVGRLDEVVEPRNYLSHARRPLLMVGGELDFLFPFETSQRGFFDAWGAPEQDKRLVGLPFGHTPREMRAVADEVLRWMGARAPTGDVAGG